MKIVRVINNRVVEIIPETATPVSKWYNETFASQCIEAPDEVTYRWYYNPDTGTFSEEADCEGSLSEMPVTVDRILNALLGVTDDAE